MLLALAQPTPLVDPRTTVPLTREAWQARSVLLLLGSLVVLSSFCS